MNSDEFAGWAKTWTLCPGELLDNSLSRDGPHTSMTSKLLTHTIPTPTMNMLLHCRESTFCMGSLTWGKYHPVSHRAAEGTLGAGIACCKTGRKNPATIKEIVLQSLAQPKIINPFASGICSRCDDPKPVDIVGECCRLAYQGAHHP